MSNSSRACCLISFLLYTNQECMSSQPVFDCIRTEENVETLSKTEKTLTDRCETKWVRMTQYVCHRYEMVQS